MSEEDNIYLLLIPRRTITHAIVSKLHYKQYKEFKIYIVYIVNLQVDLEVAPVLWTWPWTWPDGLAINSAWEQTHILIFVPLYTKINKFFISFVNATSRQHW